MKIGTEELTFIPETKMALDIEMLAWHIPLFTIVFAYALGYISWPIFFLLFYLVDARIFIGQHDRIHADRSKRFPRFADAFIEGLALCVTPWDEPYDSYLKKHLRHHTSHRPDSVPVFDTRNDPHSAFELGGFLQASVSCLFYEERQFLLDVRNKKLTKSRLNRLFIYLPIQILFLVMFGWEKYLGVFIAARFVGFVSWFVFSWGIHRPYIYRFGFANQVPTPLRMMLLFTNGKRTMDGVLHHISHHAWPRAPSSQLHEFDAAILRNPAAAPNLIPTRS
jgi:fatty acid desaturase